MLLSPQRVAVSCLLPLLAATAGCTVNLESDQRAPSEPEIVTPGEVAPTTWTIFVYGHGDHNLSPSLANDIEKMGKAELGPNVNVIVLADWNASAADDEGKPIYASGSEWYRIRGSGLEPELLRTEPEQDLDDGATLSGAIARAFRDYPADRYGLVLWDHGGSWDGGYGSDTQNGTRPKPKGMSVPTVAQAVRAGLAAADLEGDRRLEFLAFDTCLMGGAEVAYAMEKLAKVYIANAEIDYGSGLNYADTLTHIARVPDATAQGLARYEVHSWDALHSTAGADDALLRSHIAIDTAKIEAFAAATSSFATIVANAPDGAERMAASGYFALPAYFATLADGVIEPRYRDYGQVLGALANDASGDPIATAAQEVERRLSEMTLGMTSGTLREGQAGFHIAFPPPKKLSSAWFDSYSHLASDWAQSSRWDVLLQSIFTKRDVTPPVLTTDIVNSDCATADSCDAHTTVSLESPDRDIGIATLSLFAPDEADPSMTIRYGLVGTTAMKAGETRRMRWDGTALAVEGQPATVVPWMTTGREADGAVRPSVVAVLGTLSFGGEEMEGALLCSEGDDTAEVVMLTTPSGQSAALTMAELIADDPTATFTPAVVVKSASGGAGLRAGSPITLAKEGLSIAAKPLPAGSYGLRVEAEDIWGNTTTVERPVEVKR